jgi:hypothetical protein
LEGCGRDEPFETVEDANGRTLVKPQLTPPSLSELLLLAKIKRAESEAKAAKSEPRAGRVHELFTKARSRWRRSRLVIGPPPGRGGAIVLSDSPRIGGLGITLTAASFVLIVEFDFTSAIMLQCEDRVHRFGQTRHVSVEYLYANKTVDGFMLALINRKQRIFDQACDGLADPEFLLRLSKKV